ncbi:MAG: nucleotidyltransferase family protein [Novosphingobium sp.]
MLGAGAASRFGADKIAAPCAGLPLGQWALDAALATGLGVIWLTRDSPPAFAKGRCEIRHNPRAAEGMGSSVALAAALAEQRGASGVLIMLADMPLVAPALLERLIAAGAPAACRYPGGHAGVPTLLPAACFPALQVLNGQQGAGPILRNLPGLTLLDCPADELIDVDRPADLARAEHLLSARQ